MREIRDRYTSHCTAFVLVRTDRFADGMVAPPAERVRRGVGDGKIDQVRFPLLGVIVVVVEQQ